MAQRVYPEQPTWRSLRELIEVRSRSSCWNALPVYPGQVCAGIEALYIDRSTA
jgi:hypothetical protein